MCCSANTFYIPPTLCYYWVAFGISHDFVECFFSVNQSTPRLPFCLNIQLLCYYCSLVADLSLKAFGKNPFFAIHCCFKPSSIISHSPVSFFSLGNNILIFLPHIRFISSLSKDPPPHPSTGDIAIYPSISFICNTSQFSVYLRILTSSWGVT